MFPVVIRTVLVSLILTAPLLTDSDLLRPPLTVEPRATVAGFQVAMDLRARRAATPADRAIKTLPENSYSLSDTFALIGMFSCAASESLFIRFRKVSIHY